MSIEEDNRPGGGSERQTPVNEQKFQAKESANNDPVDSVFFLQGQSQSIETGENPQEASSYDRSASSSQQRWYALIANPDAYQVRTPQETDEDL